MSQEEADLREGSGDDACSNVSARTAGLTGFRAGIKVGIRDTGKMRKDSGFQARLRCVCLGVCLGGGRAPGFKRPPTAFLKRPGFTSELHPETLAGGARMQGRVLLSLVQLGRERPNSPVGGCCGQRGAARHAGEVSAFPGVTEMSLFHLLTKLFPLPLSIVLLGQDTPASPQTGGTPGCYNFLTSSKAFCSKVVS